MSQRPTASDDPVSEAAGSIGLLLNIAALVMFAVALAGFGLGQVAFAGSLGIAASLGFATSLVCFAIDGRSDDEVVNASHK